MICLCTVPANTEMETSCAKSTTYYVYKLRKKLVLGGMRAQAEAINILDQVNHSICTMKL